MKIKYILTIAILAILPISGYFAWNFFASPQYSLKQIQKAIERRDRLNFEKYVNIEGVIRHAGSQLSSQISDSFLKELSGFGGIEPETLNGAMAAFGPAILESTVKQVREAILRFIETRSATPVQTIPNEILTIAKGFRLESIPSIAAKGDTATIDVHLSTMGEPVHLCLSMYNRGRYWQVAKIDKPSEAAQEILSAHVYGRREHFEAERATHPDIDVEVPGMPPRSTPLTMCYIPEGKFKMGTPEKEMVYGDDELQHNVTISKPFWIGKFEVTNSQFEAFVEATGYETQAETEGWGYTLNTNTGDWEKSDGATFKNPGAFPIESDTPVVLVSWNDAQAFCMWLSEQSGWNFRLPTEAEWEYACRAGTSTIRFTGDSDNSLSGYVNSMDASFKLACDKWACFDWNDGYVYTSPAGSSFKPNPWGLHDMLGNVFEWCSDWYGEYPPGEVTDPTGAEPSWGRVRRGGGWYGGPWRCRAANRNWNSPDDRYSHLGFRPAASAAVR